MTFEPSRNDSNVESAHVEYEVEEIQNSDSPIQSLGTVPFPSANSALNIDVAASSSSNITSSDKLSALPQSSPPLPQLRTLSRVRRVDGTSSLPSFESTPPSTSQIQIRDNESDGSVGLETPKRVSFESDHMSPPFQNLRQAPPRGVRSSDPSIPQHMQGYHMRVNSGGSRSPSRGHSPLRMFWPLNRAHSREEPFIPIDPYKFTFAFALPDKVSIARRRDAFTTPLLNYFDLFIRQVYRHILFRLPSIYFTRVSRIFEDAEVSRPDIQRMIEGCARGADFPQDWNPPAVSPALSRFKHSWEEFVDSVMKEWKTLNIVSALLLSALVSMFQITDAANDPVTRTASLLSLVCALMSLTYGCVFILRFGTMRSMYKASRWAEEAQKTKQAIFWNVWVLLATPAVWLAWSMLFFCVSILAYIWTSGSTSHPQPLPPHIEIIPRIAVTSVFALGVLYFFLIIHTFKSYAGGRPRSVALGTAMAMSALGLGGAGKDGAVGMRSESTDVEKAEQQERGRTNSRLMASPKQNLTKVSSV